MAFVASSGDNGAPDSCPAASPNVLSVGGTALTLGAGNVWSNEVGWSGSGGGPSVYESQPSYQKGVVTQTSSSRATPDVAYDASPSTGFAVYDSVPYGGTTYGWFEVGGTSAGAPQWSALLAIADQGRALSGQPALDSSGPQQVMSILYENPTDFHDITSGTSTGSPNYSAGLGYDYVTGMGSPIANLIVGSLDGTTTAATDKLVLAAPTVETAGRSFSLTVTAQNSSGTTDTGYLGTIHFTSSDVQAGLPASFAFTAADKGSYTFAVTLKTAGSQSITATDTSTSAITGTLSGVSVSPASASRFILSGLPSSATAGVSQSLTVTAEDPYGNVATGYIGTVHFSSSDPKASLPANYTFASANNGVHAFALTFATAGTQWVTVADTVASQVTSTQSGISVTPAAPINLAASPVSSSQINLTWTGSSGATGYLVQQGQSGNNIWIQVGNTTSTTFQQTGLSAGSTYYYRVLATLGTLDSAYSIVASATTAALHDKLVLVAPTAETAGRSFSLTVTAQNSSGTTDTGYLGTIHFTSSDVQAGLPASFAFIAADKGSYTFAVTLKTAGSQWITATDSSTSAITGTLSGVSVSPASASRFILSGLPSSATAGVSQSLTVTAGDPYGNVATGYIGTVHFSSSDSKASLPANYTFATANNGVHAFALTFGTAGTQSVMVADTVASQVTSTQSGISVTPAAPINLAASPVSSSQINLTWTGSSGATGYLIQQSQNGSTGWTQVGNTTSTTFQQTRLSAGTTYYYRVLATLGTTDSAYSNVASAVTTGNTATADSIWGNSYIPPSNSFSYGSYEVGVKFIASVAGEATGARFYKQAWMGGYTQVGNLWSSTGTLLATATYTNESASGWQQVSFSSPVAISANTVYIVSFSTGGGYFGLTPGFFSTGGVTNGPLQALPNSVSGGDGVYNRAGYYPDVDSNGVNFWADVAFTPSSSSGAPASIPSRASHSIVLGGLGASALISNQSSHFFLLAPETIPAGPARDAAGVAGQRPLSWPLCRIVALSLGSRRSRLRSGNRHWHRAQSEDR